MRTFVALDIPPAAAERIRAEQQALKRWMRADRWQPVHNLHVTLHFLGEVDESLIPHLKEDLDAVCSVLPPFFLELGSFGFFPHAAAPRVMWLGLEGERERLIRLHALLGQRFARHAGVTIDTKPFRPHITLARGVDPGAAARLAASDGVSAHSVSPPRWQVTRVHLYRSELKPTGAVHTILHTGILAGTE